MAAPAEHEANHGIPERRAKHTVRYANCRDVIASLNLTSPAGVEGKS
jgi:hypothetical protein